MSNQLCFIDSSIWLCFLSADPESNEKEKLRKQEDARYIIKNKNSVVSTQVIDEVCFVLLEKAKFDEERIKQVIQSFYRRASVVYISRDILISASDLRTQYNFSFWDGLIIASALAINAKILYSENMQNNLVINERLTIINPFISSG